MKTVIILVLLVVACGGAYLSRPSQSDFATFIKAQNATQTPGSVKDVLKAATGTFSTDIYLQSITFQDYKLWTSVAQNGQTQYVGVFSHWWKLSSGSSGAAAKS
jgi:hypothetical protein